MLHETPCDAWSAKVQRYIDRVKLGKTIAELIHAESEMLALAEKALATTNDPVAQFLLKHLKHDEDHHKSSKN